MAIPDYADPRARAELKAKVPKPNQEALARLGIEPGDPLEGL